MRGAEYRPTVHLSPATGGTIRNNCGNIRIVNGIRTIENSTSIRSVKGDIYILGKIYTMAGRIIAKVGFP